MKKIEAWTIVKGMAAGHIEAEKAADNLVEDDYQQFSDFLVEINNDIAAIVPVIENEMNLLGLIPRHELRTAAEGIHVFQQFAGHKYEQILLAMWLDKENLTELLLDEVKPNG